MMTEKQAFSIKPDVILFGYCYIKCMEVVSIADHNLILQGLNGKICIFCF